MAFPLVVGGVIGTVALGAAIGCKLQNLNSDPLKNDKNCGERLKALIDTLPKNNAAPEQGRYCQTPGHVHR